MQPRQGRVRHGIFSGRGRSSARVNLSLGNVLCVNVSHSEALDALRLQRINGTVRWWRPRVFERIRGGRE